MSTDVKIVKDDVKFIDPTSLTIDQLKALLDEKLKSNTNTVTSLITDTSSRPKVDEISNENKKCAFRPVRINQEECKDNAVIFYGKLGYCSRHRRSVQALNAKKNNETVKVSEKIETIKEEKKEPLQTKKELIEEKNNDKKGISSEIVKKPKSGDTSDTSVSETPKIAPVAKENGNKVVKKKIKPNAWGRFEDPDTNIIFDPVTKVAYGVQDHVSGRVINLSPNHIEICKRYQWKYTSPSTMVERCKECRKPKSRCECVEDYEVVDEEEEMDENEEIGDDEGGDEEEEMDENEEIGDDEGGDEDEEDEEDEEIDEEGDEDEEDD